MVSGFISNFNDSGYTLTTANFYDANNNQVTTPISSNDIYYTTQQVGIYMIQGTYDVSNIFYPVICSATNVINLGLPNNSDSAWLIYPGFGLKLFSDPSYTGVPARLYANTSTVPQVFYCGNIVGTGWVGHGTPIIVGGGAQQGQPYSQNFTSSLKVYFRGTEITVN